MSSSGETATVFSSCGASSSPHIHERNSQFCSRRRAPGKDGTFCQQCVAARAAYFAGENEIVGNLFNLDFFHNRRFSSSRRRTAVQREKDRPETVSQPYDTA